MDRAYSILNVKALDAERRMISGTATTPEVDRVGDIIEPKGVQFRNPLPLLLYHDATKPVGLVTFAQPTAKGVEFEAHLPEIKEPGSLRDRVEEAWQSVKHKLIAGVSIGFRPVDDAIEVMKTGGLRFLKTEVMELSLVVIPANSAAVISNVKSLDTGLAASGTGSGSEPSHPAGVSAPIVRLARKDASPMTITEQISGFEATRQAKSARMTEIMTVAAKDGVTLNTEQSQEYDGLETEVKSIDDHLKRLNVLEQTNKAAAKPVNGGNAADASASRGGQTPIIAVNDRLEPGIGFARAVKCQIVSQREFRPALDVAKEMYPSDSRLHNHFVQKTAVGAGTTTGATWAGPLVDPVNLATEFIEYLRPMTIIGKFGTNGIPSLRRIPFNVRITGQTSGGNADWVGQGAPKPLTKFDFNAVTHAFTKVAAISVITQELARFSSPSAEMLVRDGLAGAIIARIDTDFVDPDKAAVANVSPASITNGVAPIASSGSSNADVRVDIMALFAPFIAANVTPTSGVIIMSHTTALAVSLMQNALGQAEYPGISMNGGTFQGLPVITSEYVHAGSPLTQLVILVNASDIFLSDDGQVTVDSSREASLQMDDAPTNNSATPTATSVVSMYQTNSIALRAERYINWSKRRSGAVQFLENVVWGAGGGS